MHDTAIIAAFCLRRPGLPDSPPRRAHCIHLLFLFLGTDSFSTFMSPSAIMLLATFLTVTAFVRGETPLPCGSLTMVILAGQGARRVRGASLLVLILHNVAAISRGESTGTTLESNSGNLVWISLRTAGQYTDRAAVRSGRPG